MRGNRRHTGTNDGFILLEALVSIILLSMVLVLFATTLTFARRVAAAGNGRDSISETSMGVNTISQWLASAVPARDIGSGGEGAARFDGRGSQLSFVTLSNGDTQPGGMLAVTVSLVPPIRGQLGALAFSSSPVKIGASPVALPVEQHQVLIGNVSGAEFRYFGAPNEGNIPAWHRAWANAARLPIAVGLRVATENKGRTEHFDLTFRIVSN
jgi:general secretion pathway protein J